MSCSPLKQTATTRSRSDDNRQGQFTADREITRDSIFFRELYEALREQLAIEHTRHRATAEDVETVTRVYDTSRPVDTLTGKPPLLRETTQRRHRTDSVRDASRLQQTQTRDSHMTAEGMAQEQQQLQFRGEYNRQTAVDTATETESRRGLLWWQKALCCMGLLTLLYIFYRIFNHH